MALSVLEFDCVEIDSAVRVLHQVFSCYIPGIHVHDLIKLIDEETCDILDIGESSAECIVVDSVSLCR